MKAEQLEGYTLYVCPQRDRNSSRRGKPAHAFDTLVEHEGQLARVSSARRRSIKLLSPTKNITSRALELISQGGR